MKWFLAAVGVSGAGAVFAVWVLIELVARLAPVLIVAAIAWAVFAGIRARRRVGDDAHWHERWAQTPRSSAAPTPPTVATPVPHAPHYERFYLVRGDDTGFAADRHDGYLHVSAPVLPPAVVHQSRVPALRRRHRRRPTRPSTRP